MHARHRSLGNGYRSGSMGIGGLAAASHVSPESSFRGHGFYNSNYRSYNRGFGRGRSKSSQAPQSQTRRGGDIFMEAGRLATEYLVSKGLLPTDVLSGKWHNNSWKNRISDFRGFMLREGDNLRLPPEGRTSALTRLVNAVPDMGPERSRYPEDNKLGQRHHERGSRRMGSFKNNGLQLNPELGRSGFASDKTRSFTYREVNEGVASVSQEVQQVGEDIGNGLQKSPPTESTMKIDNANDSQPALEKNQIADDADLERSSTIGKDLPSEAETIMRSNNTRILETGIQELKDSNNNDETEQYVAENITIQHLPNNDETARKTDCDLVSLCKFAKVPTKIRSALTTRARKVDSVAAIKDETTHESGPSKESEVLTKYFYVDGSCNGDALTNHGESSKCPESENFKAPVIEDTGELGLAYGVNPGKCLKSVSFHESSLMNEQETTGEQPGFGRSNSMPMALERGEKRAWEQSDVWEESKKPRESIPSTDVKADNYFHLYNTKEKELASWDGTSSNEEEGRPDDISLFPKGGSEPCIQYAEKKEPYLGLFKICDLNLVEASDVTENHNSHPILMFPPMPESKQATAPVDIDLTMANSINLSDTYVGCGTDGKVVEVIDLENDSVGEDNAFNNPERRVDTVFTGLESFPNHSQNANDIPDTQENYGLMISELLGNDIPTCSSMTPDINSLHDNMSLHNGEGILGDDDSIYMSLGEIPISFVRVWEQQTQEYEKPF